jgi:hypothetical protein
LFDKIYRFEKIHGFYQVENTGTIKDKKLIRPRDIFEIVFHKSIERFAK